MMQQGPQKPQKKHVRECRGIRENGDSDVLYLCIDYIPSVDDFFTIKKSRRYPTRCERCGWSKEQEEFDKRIGSATLHPIKDLRSKA